MESYIPISFLNDFVFCPRSVYFHQIYRDYDDYLYYEDIQIKAKMSHKSIDQKKYSTKKEMLQAFPVFSNEFNLCGRIDIFNEKTGLLTERKKNVKKIYDGYVFQIYAQYYCLKEMGYMVNKLRIYSLDHNKSYTILLPKDDPLMDLKFKNLLKKIMNFEMDKKFYPNFRKCKQCIYKYLCDYGLEYVKSA